MGMKKNKAFYFFVISLILFVISVTGTGAYSYFTFGEKVYGQQNKDDTNVITSIPINYIDGLISGEITFTLNSFDKNNPPIINILKKDGTVLKTITSTATSDNGTTYTCKFDNDIGVKYQITNYDNQKVGHIDSNNIVINNLEEHNITFIIYSELNNYTGNGITGKYSWMTLPDCNDETGYQNKQCKFFSKGTGDYIDFQNKVKSIFNTINNAKYTNYKACDNYNGLYIYKATYKVKPNSNSTFNAKFEFCGARTTGDIKNIPIPTLSMLNGNWWEEHYQYGSSNIDNDHFVNVKTDQGGNAGDPSLVIYEEQNGDVYCIIRIITENHQ